jgi:hypothetical protein
LLPFPLATQQIEKIRALEDLAHARGRFDDPEPAMRGGRHVESPNQLADAGSIDSRDGRQVQDDPPLSTEKEGANIVTKCSTDRRPQSAFDAHDVDCFGTQLQAY